MDIEVMDIESRDAKIRELEDRIDTLQKLLSHEERELKSYKNIVDGLRLLMKGTGIWED